MARRLRRTPSICSRSSTAPPAGASTSFPREGRFRTGRSARPRPPRTLNLTSSAIGFQGSRGASRRSTTAVVAGPGLRQAPARLPPGPRAERRKHPGRAGRHLLRPTRCTRRRTFAGSCTVSVRPPSAPFQTGWRRATFSLPTAVLRNTAENTMCCFSAAISKKTSPVTNGGLLALLMRLSRSV